MKKQIAIMTVLSLAITGCAANAAPSPGDNGAVPQATSAEQKSVQGASTDANPAAASEGESTQPGSRGDAPQGKRVRGQIKDILGNEVTLALLEEPKRPEGTGEVEQKPKAAGDPMGGPPNMGGGSSSVKLTGETLGIQIPVGVPIASRSKDGDTSLQLSDLSTGDILTLLYDSDGVTILRVNVSSGSAQ